MHTLLAPANGSSSADEWALGTTKSLRRGVCNDATSHAQASKHPQRHGPQKLLLCAETSAMSWTAGIRAESESEQTQRLEGRVIVSEVLDFFACSKAVAQNAALAALAATGAWQHSHLGPCRS